MYLYGRQETISIFFFLIFSLINQAIYYYIISLIVILYGRQNVCGNFRLTKFNKFIF